MRTSMYTCVCISLSLYIERAINPSMHPICMYSHIMVVVDMPARIPASYTYAHVLYISTTNVNTVFQSRKGKHLYLRGYAPAADLSLR